MNTFKSTPKVEEIPVKTPEQLESETKDKEAKEKIANEQAAQQLYATYIKALDHTDINGRHLPSPEVLFKESQYTREANAWLAVAKSQ